MPVEYLVYFCDRDLLLDQTDYLHLTTWKGQRLSLAKRCEDTVVILSNYKTKQIFGLCRLRFWPERQSCLRLAESADGSHGAELYYIGIRDFTRFTDAISYETIKTLLNVPDVTGASNIWKRGRNCKVAFYSGSNAGLVVRDFKRLIQTIAGIY
jgi:hypothetical protein